MYTNTTVTVRLRDKYKTNSHGSIQSHSDLLAHSAAINTEAVDKLSAANDVPILRRLFGLLKSEI